MARAIGCRWIRLRVIGVGLSGAGARWLSQGSLACAGGHQRLPEFVIAVRGALRIFSRCRLDPMALRILISDRDQAAVEQGIQIGGRARPGGWAVG